MAVYLFRLSRLFRLVLFGRSFDRFSKEETQGTAGVPATFLLLRGVGAIVGRGARRSGRQARPAAATNRRSR